MLSLRPALADCVYCVLSRSRARKELPSDCEVASRGGVVKDPGKLLGWSGNGGNWTLEKAKESMSSLHLETAGSKAPLLQHAPIASQRPFTCTHGSSQRDMFIPSQR